MIIGLASQAQMGKNVVGDYLLGKLDFDFELRAFAKGVKQIFAETFDVSYEFIEEWKVKDEVPPGFQMPVRKGLQFIGDGCRNIRNTIWIDLALRDDAPKIMTDVRYPNEFIRIKQEGGFNVLLARPSKLNYDPNGSEALIRPYVEWALANLKSGSLDEQPLESAPDGMVNFDYFIRNDGTLEELYANVDKMIPYISAHFVPF